MSGPLPILVVVGLVAEARIAAGPGVVTVAGGGDAAGLALAIEAALDRGVRAVISFGIAGGLASGVPPGTVLIGRAVHDGTRRSPADAGWIAQLSTLLPAARLGDLVGVDAAVAGADAKAALHRHTGAAAVDMESHVAARLAAQNGIPFAALRVVADPAERTLPPAALVGMRADGTTDLGAVLRSLGREPRQLAALVRTGFDARAALAALAASRTALIQVLGPRATRRAAGGRRGAVEAVKAPVVEAAPRVG